MSKSAIHFSRKPYQVIYKDFHTGELKTIRRRPPAKNHEMLPTDVVSLKNTRNEKWQESDEVTVRHISHRAPNVLQVENADGQTTFVPSHDLNLEEKVAWRFGQSSPESSDFNRYLRWP
ncbi:MAG: hypothetical protein AB8C84_08985 [Oligoflexales bacterium]